MDGELQQMIDTLRGRDDKLCLDAADEIERAHRIARAYRQQVGIARRLSGAAKAFFNMPTIEHNPVRRTQEYTKLHQRWKDFVEADSGRQPIEA